MADPAYRAAGTFKTLNHHPVLAGPVNLRSIPFSNDTRVTRPRQSPTIQGGPSRCPRPDSSMCESENALLLAHPHRPWPRASLRPRRADGWDEIRVGGGSAGFDRGG